MKKIFFKGLIFVFLISSFGCRSISNFKKEYVIAFGSCNQQDDEQSIWNLIKGHEADAWIWLGDIIYADTEDMALMKSMYDRQKSSIAYSQLAESTWVIGTWDDHDYGANNAGKEYPMKDSSKILLLDFLDVPQEHDVRSRPGAYQNYMVSLKDFTISIILLDVRSFRDELEDTSGTILGNQQWTWLEKVLSESSADLHIIGGGIQFLPVDHRYEKWHNFPDERTRFLDLLSALEVKNPILISGDRHFAEMMHYRNDDGFELVEVTSSGLTHAYESLTEEANRFRIGEFYPGINFGLMRVVPGKGIAEISIFSEYDEVVLKHQIQLKE